MVALLLGGTSLFAQLTPYEYGHRWYFSVQGGSVMFTGDHSGSLYKFGSVHKMFSAGGSAALGYNITDAHEIRFAAVYGRRNDVCEPFTFEDPVTGDKETTIYTYSFRTAQLFADYVLNFNALAEYNVALTPRAYFGLGAAVTYDFSDPGHPEVWLSDPNLVPGYRMGAILEYDFPSGFGFFGDLGIAFYLDRFNGRQLTGMPVDIDLALQFGMIYHFQLAKNARR